MPDSDEDFGDEEPELAAALAQADAAIEAQEGDDSAGGEAAQSLQAKLGAALKMCAGPRRVIEDPAAGD